MNSPRHMLRRQMTVAEAMQFLRQHYDDEHDLNYLYVLDGGEAPVADVSGQSLVDEDRLAGIISLRTVILADPEARMDNIMDSDVLTVRASADQEEVARILAR